MIAVIFFLVSVPALAQIPPQIGIRILKAEDARRYSPELQNLMYHAGAAVRSRAALAAGRIGNDAATILETRNEDRSRVRAMAASRLGDRIIKGSQLFSRHLES